MPKQNQWTSRLGFLLAAVLFTLFGILLVRLTQVAHTDEMDRLLVPWNIPWLRAASGIVAAAFLFGVVVIMAAGSGALLEQMTGLLHGSATPCSCWRWRWWLCWV